MSDTNHNEPFLTTVPTPGRRASDPLPLAVQRRRRASFVEKTERQTFKEETLPRVQESPRDTAAVYLFAGSGDGDAVLDLLMFLEIPALMGDKL